MQSLLEEPGLRGFQVRPAFKEISDDKIVGSSEWTDAAGKRHERYAVITIRDGEIADMQVCGSWRQARRFANRTSLRATA